MFQIIQCLFKAIALGGYFFFLLLYFFSANMYFMLKQTIVFYKLKRSVMRERPYTAAKQAYVNNVRPPGLPPWRIYSKTQLRRFTPIPIGAFADDFKSIFARPQIDIIPCRCCACYITPFSVGTN